MARTPTTAPATADDDDFAADTTAAPVADAAPAPAEPAVEPTAAPAIEHLKVAEGNTIIYGDNQTAVAASIFQPVSQEERDYLLEKGVAVELDDTDKFALAARSAA